METKFGVALNEQGRFSSTNVGDFTLVPGPDIHLWKGKTASSMSELAEQVNGAIESLAELGDPFIEIRVVAISDETTAPSRRTLKLAGET